MSHAQLPPLTTMISELVRTPSVSSVNPEFDMSNRPVCERLAGWLETAGGAVELMTLPGPRDNLNLIARFGHGPPGLALCGHTDTVPYDDSLWSHDPLGGEMIDDRLYGLGSADMKGFLALCATACAATSPGSLQRSILVIGSADEESSMDGARHLCETNFSMPPFCVVGEPTGMQPVHQHKGILMERVTLTGRSGHSSNPALGHNAIDGMHEVIASLQQFREELQANHRDNNFEVPVPTLNLGHIRGGDNPNRICGSCALDFDLRLMPGMTVTATRVALHRFLRSKMVDSPLQLDFTALFAGAEPLSTPRSSPLLHACEKHTGNAAGCVNFCTEGPFYQALGADTVIMGPGDIEVAHQPDEFLPLTALSPHAGSHQPVNPRFLYRSVSNKMTHHRVFSTTSLTTGTRVELSGEQAHYLGKVLRLKPDDPVVLFDLQGLEFSCTVVNITRNSVTLQVGSASAPATESQLNAWLVQGLVRGERMDYCVQKTTELGVKKILPVFTARSVVRLSAERANKRLQHWEKIAISACEQSGRVTPPTIHAPQSLEALLADDLPEAATLVCLQPGTAPAPLNDIAHDNAHPLVLMVGPEGGFDEREQEILRDRGAHMVAMGPRVLRSETAGIVGLTLCQSVWGDF